MGKGGPGLIHDDADLAALPFVGDPVGFNGLVEREAVRNNNFRFKFPLDQLFHQVFHMRKAGNPGAINRNLIVNNGLANVKADGVAFPDHRGPAPTARSLERQ